MKRTTLAIDNGKFKINGEYTYKGREYKGISLEGLLMNSRMVQGIFDDRNNATVSRWAYPDTGKWDAERNTSEFLEAMDLWKYHGLNCFTINLQGGSPEGYSKGQPWINTAFNEDGTLDSYYMGRLESILDKADRLEMAVILGYFYFGQEKCFSSEEIIHKAVEEATSWVLDKGYKNVMIEINNECNVKYVYPIMKPQGVHLLIEKARQLAPGLLVSTSFGGGSIPTGNVVAVSDFLLLHGNGVQEPERIEKMILELRAKPEYSGQPIVFNEDDHFNFYMEDNNMLRALKNGASWGYFDPGHNNYTDGYQCPPVNWGINSELKKQFFSFVKELTGA